VANDAGNKIYTAHHGRLMAWSLTTDAAAMA